MPELSLFRLRGRQSQFQEYGRKADDSTFCLLSDGILLSISIESMPLDLSCCFSLRIDSSVSLKTITFWLGCFVFISSIAVASLFSAEASSAFLFLTFRNQAFACQLGKPPCFASSIIALASYLLNRAEIVLIFMVYSS